MKCNHDPMETKGPIGMYHCPECGQMVLAGVPHPISEDDIDYDELDKLNKLHEEMYGKKHE